MSAITLKQGPQLYSAYATAKLTTESPNVPLATSDILLMALPKPVCLSLLPLPWHMCVHSHAHLSFALKSSLIPQIPVLCSVPIAIFSIKEVSVDVSTALPQKWHYLKEKQWQIISVKGKWESREIALLVKNLPASTKTWLQLSVLTLKSGE